MLLLAIILPGESEGEKPECSEGKWTCCVVDEMAPGGKTNWFPLIEFERYDPESPLSMAPLLLNMCMSSALPEPLGEIPVEGWTNPLLDPDPPGMPIPTPLMMLPTAGPTVCLAYDCVGWVFP